MARKLSDFFLNFFYRYGRMAAVHLGKPSLCNSKGLHPSGVYCNGCLRQTMRTFSYCDSHESQQQGKTPRVKIVVKHFKKQNQGGGWWRPKSLFQTEPPSQHTLRFPLESIGVHWSCRFEMNTMRFPLESIGVHWSWGFNMHVGGFHWSWWFGGVGGVRTEKRHHRSEVLKAWWYHLLAALRSRWWGGWGWRFFHQIGKHLNFRIIYLPLYYSYNFFFAHYEIEPGLIFSKHPLKKFIRPFWHKCWSSEVERFDKIVKILKSLIFGQLLIMLNWSD